MRLWKLQEEINRLSTAGVEFVESNGTLNTYAYWAGHHFALCPPEFPFPPVGPAMLQVGTDFIRDLRVAERRRNDVHAALLDSSGTSIRVRRFASRPFFEAMRAIPLYIADELLRNGELAGVCEQPGLYVWVWGEAEGAGPQPKDFLYQLWEAVLSWSDRLSPALDQAISHPPPAGPRLLHIRLKLSDESAWTELRRPAKRADSRPVGVVDRRTATVRITVPFGFLSLLMRPANDGERALLELIAESAFQLISPVESLELGQEALVGEPRASVRELVARVMGGADTRFIHMFEARSPTDRIAAIQSRQGGAPRFVLAEDTAAWEDGLAWHVLDRDTLAIRGESFPGAGAELDASRGGQSSRGHTGASATSGAAWEEARTIAGVSPCTSVLNSLVDVVWLRLRAHLATLNGPHLVAHLLENNERIFRDREQWRRTARAVTALYGAAEDVGRISAIRDSERSAASNAARILIEMAVCTSPRQDGRRASLTDVDRLVAGANLLVGLAFDSDAIRAELARPSLEIFPNGRIGTDRSFAATITVPFAIEVHSTDFRAAADAYAELYDRAATPEDTTAAPPDGRSETGESPEPETDPFDADFTVAFVAEYHIAPKRLLEGVVALTTLALEADSVIVRTTRGALTALLQSSHGFDELEVAAFFEMLALVPYGAWGTTPKGFRPRDWQPWRFRRRLSVVARPIIAFGHDESAPVIFGLYQIGATISYLLDNIRSAWLPEEFFTSREMLRYRGARADAEGQAFTAEVAVALCESGWETRTEVLISTLGGPSELGDIDVLAWKKGDDRLLLIECKRLQPARTIGEIAELLRQFRGESSDRLGRHLHRTDWVSKNLDLLATALGAPTSARSVTPLLVTNRDVPMRFRNDLPLPSESILSFDRLRSAFRPHR